MLETCNLVLLHNIRIKRVLSFNFLVPLSTTLLSIERRQALANSFLLPRVSFSFPSYLSRFVCRLLRRCLTSRSMAHRDARE